MTYATLGSCLLSHSFRRGRGNMERRGENPELSGGADHGRGSGIHTRAEPTGGRGPPSVGPDSPRSLRSPPPSSSAGASPSCTRWSTTPASPRTTPCCPPTKASGPGISSSFSSGPLRATPAAPGSPRRRMSSRRSYPTLGRPRPRPRPPSSFARGSAASTSTSARSYGPATRARERPTNSATACRTPTASSASRTGPEART